MESDSLEEFLTKVLSASNSDELGGEVLGVLKQWKDELNPESLSTPINSLHPSEDHKDPVDPEEPKENSN